MLASKWVPQSTQAKASPFGTPLPLSVRTDTTYIQPTPRARLRQAETDSVIDPSL